MAALASSIFVEHCLPVLATDASIGEHTTRKVRASQQHLKPAQGSCGSVDASLLGTGAAVLDCSTH